MKSRILYKYFSGSRNFFEERLIRFSPRTILNDPFEVRPSVESMARYLQTTRPFEHKSYEEILEFVRNNQEKYFHGYNGLPMLNKLGVLCLTESKRNLLMWSHYADSHKGYVVGFDTSHSFFKEHRNCGLWSQPEGVGKLRPVKYDSYRSENIDNFTDWYFHKSDDWMYEKEHRLVFPLASCDVVLKTDPDGNVVEKTCDSKKIRKIDKIGHFQYLCLFKVPKEAIVSVSLGADISQVLQMQIINSVKNMNPFVFEKAGYSETRFELDFV